MLQNDIYQIDQKLCRWNFIQKNLKYIITYPPPSQINNNFSKVIIMIYLCIFYNILHGRYWTTVTVLCSFLRTVIDENVGPTVNRDNCAHLFLHILLILCEILLLSTS